VQKRLGAEKLAVVLIDVDPGYFTKPEEHLPKAQKVLARLKLDWPNVLAPKGFQDTMQAFNLSGYGNVVVDAKGMVRGVDLRDRDLERLLEEVVEGKKAEKPER
jgi:hypothetical protein